MPVVISERSLFSVDKELPVYDEFGDQAVAASGGDCYQADHSRGGHVAYDAGADMALVYLAQALGAIKPFRPTLGQTVHDSFGQGFIPPLPKVT